MKDFEHNKKEELSHAVKPGAGGKPQNYDPTTGRFAPNWGSIKDQGEKINTSTTTAASTTNRLASGTKYNKKARHMSDDELQKAISRMELEQHYSRLNPSTTSKGASAASNVLSAIGSVAAVAASVATVALAVKEFKKP